MRFWDEGVGLLTVSFTVVRILSAQSPEGIANHTNGSVPFLPLALAMATAGLFISLALIIYLKKIRDSKGKELVWQVLAAIFGIIGGVALLGAVIGIVYFLVASGGLVQVK